MARQLSILSIGGHSKDAIITTGGTMAKHVDKGDKVSIVSLTHGALSHDDRAIDAAKKGGSGIDVEAGNRARDEELLGAARELGVTDVRFVGSDEEIVLVERPIIQELADVIGDVRPDVILTHNPHDSVPGHAVAGQITLLAMDVAKGLRPGKPYTPIRISQVFYHVQLGHLNVEEHSLPRFPTVIIDISDVIQQKVDAIRHFKSQFYGDGSPLPKKLVEVLDGYYGVYGHVPYAEAFVPYHPEVYDSLPLSEYRLELFSKSGTDYVEHVSKMLID